MDSRHGGRVRPDSRLSVVAAVHVVLREPHRHVACVEERSLRHVERVENQLAQQRLPAAAAAQPPGHVTRQRVDHVVVGRPRAELRRRRHLPDEPAGAPSSVMR